MKSSKGSETFLKWLVGLLIAAGILAMLWPIYRNTRKDKNPSQPADSTKPETSSQNNFADLFKRDSIGFKGSKYNKSDYRRWIMAQAQHETGNFNSRLSKDFNNLFGMGVPKDRPFLGYGSGIVTEGMERAAYATPAQSVADYIEWLDYTNFPVNITDPGTFVNELKKRKYFTDSTDNYLNGMNNFLA